MTGGETYNLYGSGSVGKQQHSGVGDNVVHASPSVTEALGTLLVTVETLRRHLGPGEQGQVDTAVQAIESGGTLAQLREPLGRISAIAAVVGEVGVPVLGAIRELVGLLGG